MRTLAEAERDYDRALSDGAAAVSIMDEKLKRQEREAWRMLAAVVLSAGGIVEVDHRSMIDSYDADVRIEEIPATGGLRITARRKIIGGD